MALVLVLMLGLIGGAAAGFYVRPYYDARLDTTRQVDAEVIDETQEAGRLVLRLRAGRESLLATYSERAGEVGELVAEGDMLRIRIPNDVVIVDNPPILRVRRRSRGRNQTEEAEVISEITDAGVGTELPTDAASPEPSEDETRSRRRSSRRGDEGPPQESATSSLAAR